MNNNMAEFGAGFIAGVILAGALAVSIHYSAYNGWQATAVKNGAATWEADENGMSVFRWKTGVRED